MRNGVAFKNIKEAAVYLIGESNLAVPIAQAFVA